MMLNDSIFLTHKNIGIINWMNIVQCYNKIALLRYPSISELSPGIINNQMRGQLLTKPCLANSPSCCPGLGQVDSTVNPHTYQMVEQYT